MWVIIYEERMGVLPPYYVLVPSPQRGVEITSSPPLEVSVLPPSSKRGEGYCFNLAKKQAIFSPTQESCSRDNAY